MTHCQEYDNFLWKTKMLLQLYIVVNWSWSSNLDECFEILDMN